MSARLPSVGAEGGGKTVAGARETRHHSSHGDTHDFAYFAIRQVAQFAQHYYLPQLSRQRVDRCLNALALRSFDSQVVGRPWIRNFLRRVVGNRHRRPILPTGFVQAVAAVPNDGEKPRPCVFLTQAREVPKRSEHCLLHHVLRVVLVPQ